MVNFFGVVIAIAVLVAILTEKTGSYPVLLLLDNLFGSPLLGPPAIERVGYIPAACGQSHLSGNTDVRIHVFGGLGAPVLGQICGAYDSDPQGFHIAARSELYCTLNNSFFIPRIPNRLRFPPATCQLRAPGRPKRA